MAADGLCCLPPRLLLNIRLVHKRKLIASVTSYHSAVEIDPTSFYIGPYEWRKFNRQHDVTIKAGSDSLLGASGAVRCGDLRRRILSACLIFVQFVCLVSNSGGLGFDIEIVGNELMKWNEEMRTDWRPIGLWAHIRYAKPGQDLD